MSSKKLKSLCSVFLSLSMTMSCIGIPMVRAAADTSAIVIEGESTEAVLSDTSAGQSITVHENEAASGGKYVEIKTAADSVFPDDGFYVSYPFTAETAGTYTLYLQSGDLSNNALSTYSVAVDGGAFLPINRFSATVPTGESAAVVTNVNKYFTTAQFQLAAGEHTFRYKINNARPGDKRGYSFFDCARLTYAGEADFNTAMLPANAPHINNFAEAGTGLEAYDTEFALNTLKIKSGADAPFPDTGLIVTYPFDSAQDGLYSFTVSAGPFAERGWLSPYAVSVNGGAYADITSANAGDPADPNGGWNQNCTDPNNGAANLVGIYNTTLKFALKKGANTVSFKVTGNTQNAVKAFAALAYLQFNRIENPVTEVLYSDAHTTNFDSIDEGYGKPFESSEIEHATTIKTPDKTTFPPEGVIITYSFYGNAGLHQLELAASQHTGLDNFSNYAVSVNGSEFITIASNNAGSGPAPNGGILYDPHIKTYKTILTYILQDGLNTFSFKVINGRKMDDRAYAAFSSAKFLPITPDASDKVRVLGKEPHGVSYNAMDKTGREQIGQALAKDALEISTASGISCPPEGLTATYMVNVAEDGLYKLTIAATAQQDLKVAWVSPYAIKVNDGALTPVNTAVIAKDKGTDPTYPNTQSGGKDQINIYELNQTYALKAGTNLVQFTVTGDRPNGDMAIAALAYMEFEKAGALVVQDSYTIPGKSAYTLDKAGLDVTEDTSGNFLTIKTPAVETYPEPGITLTYQFNVSAEGTYRLGLKASPYARNDVSGFTVSVNGGTHTALSQSNTDPATEPSGGFIENKGIGLYHTTLDYQLTPGINTIAFRITAPRATDNQVWFNLQEIGFFLKDTQPDTVTLSAPSNGEIGTAIASTLTVHNASNIELDDVTPVYSADSQTASVDNQGVITGTQMGAAVITASVPAGYGFKTAQTTVFITSNGYCIDPVAVSTENNSTSGTTTIRNFNPEAKTVTAILALYDAEQGLKEIKVEPVTLASGGTPVPVELTVDNASEYTAKLFIWDSFQTLRPLI